MPTDQQPSSITGDGISNETVRGDRRDSSLPNFESLFAKHGGSLKTQTPPGWSRWLAGFCTTSADESLAE
jgi:hypothetical protein